MYHTSHVPVDTNSINSSPGHDKDDQQMYDTPQKEDAGGATGKLTGQGSHFGSNVETTGSTGYGSGLMEDRAGTAMTGEREAYSGSGAGVGPGAAQAAASSAFQRNREDNVPGSFPSEAADNPYATSQLDPRVDNRSAAPYGASQEPTTQYNSGVDSRPAAPYGTSQEPTTQYDSGLDSRSAAPYGTVNDPTTQYGSGVESRSAAP